MVRLVAKQSFRYAGADLKPEQTFVAIESHARVLKLMGRAVEADAEDEPSKRKYKRRDMQAEGDA